MRIVAVAAAASLAAASAFAAVDVTSPGKSVRLTVFTEGGRLSYRATFGDRPLIETSPLGLTIDEVDLGQGATIGKVDRYRIDERYPFRGVHAEAVNRCQGARIAVRHAAIGTGYTVDVRVFDDGLGFRYVVPGAEGKPRVPDAASGFRIPAGSVVWFHDFEGHYEGIHARKKIEEVRPGEWAAPPVTFQLPSGAGYAAITEAALIGYAGMALQAHGQGFFGERLGHAEPISYPFALRYPSDGERLSKPAAIAGTITTPWRVVIVGADLDTLVNSDIVANLSPPADARLFPQGIRTPWLRPGRAVWKYLEPAGENTLETMKEFSRMAAELGFEYNLVEGFWQRWPPAQLRELVHYSREQGVGIWLWKHSRDLIDAASRREFMELAREAGAVGIKVDFLDHEAKEVIDRYHAVLRDAAEFQLMVDFHGANKPTGETRTWPNEMTREAIRGLEYRRGENWGAHNTTLPFTRMLAGPADYTPLVFGERRKETSAAHQIATAAVFTSPLLVFGAHPRSLLSSPAVDLIKSIPATWDETAALPVSAIGEIAAFARRSGERWFLAVLNGPKARTVRVPLSFLGTGSYRALLVRDKADDPVAVEIENRDAARADSLELTLRPGGGFIGRFLPSTR